MPIPTSLPFVPRIEAKFARMDAWFQRLLSLLLIGILVTTVALGPVDRPAEALLLAAEVGLLGLVVGYAYGLRHRQFLRVQGRGVRISQSTSNAAGEQTYRSYDIMGRPFELQPVFVSGIVHRAIKTAPFVSLVDPSTIREGPEGRWIFQAEDSQGRPTFLDDVALAQMANFCRGHFPEEPLDEALEAMRLLQAHIKP